MVQSKVFLSRRNLVTLLAKLDGVAAGYPSKCALIKFKAAACPPKFKQSMSEILVTAVEDEEFYTMRAPGAVCEDYNG